MSDTQPPPTPKQREKAAWEQTSKGLRNTRRTAFKSIGIAGGLAVALGGVYYMMRLKGNKQCTPQEWNSKYQDLNQGFISDPRGFIKQYGPIEFYRYQTCPFCGKLQAFLDANKLDYETKEVEPMMKRELRPLGYMKVPQIVLGNKGHMVDSECIVNALAPAMKAKRGDEVEKWRNWVNTRLVKHLVVNINSSMIKSVHAFDYVKDLDFPLQSRLAARFLGGPIMYMVAKYKSLPALGLKPGEEKEVMMKELSEWTDSVKSKGGKFHGGKQPDLADIEVYGVLQSAKSSKWVWDDLNDHKELAAWMANMNTATEWKLS